jgi:hypothetical protein
VVHRDFQDSFSTSSCATPSRPRTGCPARWADKHYTGGGGGGHGLRGFGCRFSLIVMKAATPVSRAPTAVTSAEMPWTIPEKSIVLPEGGGGGGLVVVVGGSVVVEGKTAELEGPGMVDVVGRTTVGTVVDVPSSSDSPRPLTAKSVKPPIANRPSPTARIVPGRRRGRMAISWPHRSGAPARRGTPQAGWRAWGVPCRPVSAK